MDKREHRKQREHAFRKKLAEEVAGNVDDIAEILNKSKVANCGGKCKGVKEADFSDLCPECLRALEEASDEIFSVSPEMRMLEDVMSNKS
jgi:hypothetical protein